MTSCEWPVGDPLGEVNQAQLQSAILMVSSVVSKLGQGSERRIRPEHRLSHISLKRSRHSFFATLHTDTHTHCAHIRALGQFWLVWVYLSRVVWVFRALMRAYNKDILLDKKGTADFQIRRVGYYACLWSAGFSLALLSQVGVLSFVF